MLKKFTTKLYPLLLCTVFSTCAQTPKKDYYGNGQIKEEGQNIQGKKEGLWKEFHENGKLLYDSNANKKVEMVLENGAEFLIVGKPTGANFNTENIDDQKFMIIGPGIMANSAHKGDFRFTITPIKKSLVEGNLEIKVVERIENGKDFTHTFLVPVKTTTD